MSMLTMGAKFASKESFSAASEAAAAAEKQFAFVLAFMAMAPRKSFFFFKIHPKFDVSNDLELGK